MPAITIGSGSISTIGGRSSCIVAIPASDVRKQLRLLEQERRGAVPGFRRGRAPAAAVLRCWRRAAEAALVRYLRSNPPEDLRALLANAAVPPQFTPLGLRSGGVFEIEVSCLSLPQAPDPRGQFGVLAGVTPGTEPALPALSGAGPHALLPQAVRQLPQMQHLRLGGLQPAATQRGLPGAARPARGGTPRPQPPALPAVQAAPAAGAPANPVPDLAAHKTALGTGQQPTRRQEVGA